MLKVLGVTQHRNAAKNRLFAASMLWTLLWTVLVACSGCRAEMGSYPAPVRFKSLGSSDFLGRYANIRVCDYSWGDEYHLAAEVNLLLRSGGLEGLGFSTRRLPHQPGSKRTVAHLIYSGPTEPVPANEVATLLPSSRSAPREKSAARTTPVSSIAGLSRNNMSLLL